ncbi:hypothetical protein [Streptomyces sp. I05A-00742]|uniref:hypothetical protein n=1 Tax=Streptomyces sp. I05A-00742 TaxID=2732853 RepID=UPI0014879AD4|nr:hypothetical protein [Streptomyces sp. I05A-00742]
MFAMGDSVYTDRNNSDLLPNQLWFKADYDHLKKKVNDIAVTVNGISVGWDTAKASGGIWAGGLTAVKTDFTGFKVDEKGASLFGIQLKTWSWARDDKLNSAFTEKRIQKLENEIEAQYDPARDAARTANRTRGDSKAEKIARTKLEDLEKARLKLANLYQDLEKYEKNIKNKSEATRNRMEDASENLQAIKTRIEALEGSTRKVSNAIGQ